MGGLFRRWGLGVELVFNAGRALANMARTHRAVGQLRTVYQSLGRAVLGVIGFVERLATVAVPAAAGLALAGRRASGLAADLEGQMLTFRTLIGDAGKAQALVRSIQAEAARTPFKEADLLETSKRALRLTKDNTAANLELLKVTEQMAAINPTKNTVDAIEGILDATSGGGFERLKEFGFAFRAEDFEALGRPGGKAWAEGVVKALKERLSEMLRGSDLVGELSQTFAGRLSTLKDAVDATLREVGERINQRFKPILVDLTDRIHDTRDSVVGAFDLLSERWGRAWERVRPILDRALTAWEGLGTDGQARVLALAGAMVTLLSAMAPVGLLLGGLAFVVSSISGVLGPLLGLLSPAVLIPVGKALAAAALAATVFFGVFRNRGEGLGAFLQRLGFRIWDTLGAIWERLSFAVQGFVAGARPFLRVGLMEAIQIIRGPLRQLIGDFLDLLAIVAGGPNAGAWHLFGQVVGVVVVWAVKTLGRFVKVLIGVLDIARTMFGPVIAAVVRLWGAIVGLVSGTMTVREAIRNMIAGVAGFILAAFALIVSALLGVVETIFRLVSETIKSIPGASKLLGEDFTVGEDNLARARRAVSDGIRDTIAGIDRAAGDRAEASAVTIDPTFELPAAEVQVQNDVRVCIEDQEIARSVGESADRAGGRQGRPLPAEQRARVVRGDGTLTPLRPAEVI